MSVNVEVVRVFCDDEGGFGNELGIVESSADTEGREQAIARELGFSETVFVDEVSDGVATVRIFTPAMELPFAGHPSVGTAWWLGSTGRPVRILREKAGEVTVRADAADPAMVSIGAHASWAPSFDWAELASEAEVDALDPADYSGDHGYFYAWLDESTGSLRSRMFAPVMGIVEDEATGAAAVALTGRLERDLTIRQGRGSRIATTYLGEGRVEVGGRTVFDRTIAV
ncbi:PhzF family phenazine biosynthesis protein [Frondihabitans australicus]|uniref:PhzF family phenazine biosynthesis protein n=1 Tax=Frondihabitans australicus TaxID=386892 RepID=A0A495IJ74_9MICO|nr:PhzF family phenazine biosynthesis protein [Frondihabitans australicus]RKR75760.1 PhzF family phenazine biosynthesis protein [Frondihabitans australicus]